MGSIHPGRTTDWANRFAPDLDVFESLASETLAALPQELLEHCEGLQIRLAEYAEEALLDALGIEDPHDLLGLFEGIGLTEGAPQAVTGLMPNRIWLFRRPILDYWASNTESLGAIVSHVMIHEIGHHFGLSDADMEKLEAAVD